MNKQHDLDVLSSILSKVSTLSNYRMKFGEFLDDGTIVSKHQELGYRVITLIQEHCYSISNLFYNLVINAPTFYPVIEYTDYPRMKDINTFIDVCVKTVREMLDKLKEYNDD